MRFLIVITFSILLVVEIKKVISDDVIMQRNIFDALPQEQRTKKPFCNAFTGCGRKRTDYLMPVLEESYVGPSVAELTRQIVSDPRVIEAVQLARLNILSRKQKEWAGLRQFHNPFYMYPRRRCANNVGDDDC